MGKINKLDFNATYNSMVKALIGGHGIFRRGAKRGAEYDEVMRAAVGGDFERVGLIEFAILKDAGLGEGQSLVDVGCGSGRLALPLSRNLGKIDYLGIDVVPELLEYASKIVAGAPGFRFVKADGLRIPMADSTADMACFFSLFTHLLHEQSYLYLREALRVIKPGGRVVFSFLEFEMEPHWSIFESNLADVGPDGQPGSHHLNMFMSRDLIAAWQKHLDFELLEIKSGDKPCVDFEKPVTLSNGTELSGPQSLWQSLCIIAKK